MLREEFEAAYIAGDFRRVLVLMAANNRYKGDIEKLLAEFADLAEYCPEYEAVAMMIDGYPVQILGTFSLAVVEYVDGSRRGLFRGSQEIYCEAMALLKEEGEGGGAK